MTYAPTRIEERLFIGSMEHANNQQILRRHRITHILTICPTRPRCFPGVIYSHISVNDIPTARISHKFSEAFNFIDGALKHGGTVLVHCFAGVSRSGTIMISYVMKKKRMSYPEAFGYVRSRYSLVNPNSGFVRQLHEYAEYLRQNSYQC